MQFVHSGSQTEKQPPPHPALPYDVTAGAPHSAESAPSHGAAPRSLQAPHLHHPTAPRPRLFTPLHPCRSMMPGTHHPITPYPCLFATLHLCRSMAPYAYRPRAPYLRHTMLPSPTPLIVPRQVRSPPLGTAPELPEVWKQKNCKSARIFVFVRRITATGADSVMSQSPRANPAMS